MSALAKKVLHFADFSVPSPLISKNDSVKYVLFHTNWCGHCRKFLPFWNEVKDLNPSVFFESIECDTEKNKIPNGFQPKKYPTIARVVDGVVVDEFSGNRLDEQGNIHVDLKKFVTFS